MRPARSHLDVIKFFACFQIDHATSLAKREFFCLVLDGMILVAAEDGFLGVLNMVHCFFL